MPQIPKSLTQIARAARVPRHRVVYVVESRQITPIGRVGQSLVFDAAAVARILAELRRIERPDRQRIRIVDKGARND